MTSNETCGICTYDYKEIPCIIVENEDPEKTKGRLARGVNNIKAFLLDFPTAHPKDNSVTQEENFAELRRKVY